MTAQVSPQHFGVVVIGAGFGGLAAAHALKDRGEEFIVLEREQEVGGVWRDNTYPGCACDIPSNLYSLSFAPNAHWTRAFPTQPEIRDYLRRVAREHGLLPHIRFGCSLLHAAWDDAAHRWRIETSDGAITADVLIDASGPIADPSIPDLPGLDGFTGEVFHSARWSHDLDLTGRNVAVVGTGASAIQFVPQIQPLVARMTVLQRSAPWVLPRTDRATTRFERRLYAAVPALQRLVRLRQYLLRDLVLWKIIVSPRVRRIATKAALHQLHRQVADPVLRKRLTPNFELGCKRMLISNDWYPAMSAPNVEVVNAGAREVRGDSVVSSDGREHPADVIIFGTGFNVTDPPIGARLRGRDGRTLAECWNGSPHTYLGVTMTNFPNLFLLRRPGQRDRPQLPCVPGGEPSGLRDGRAAPDACTRHHQRRGPRRGTARLRWAAHGAACGHRVVGRRLHELLPRHRRRGVGQLARPYLRIPAGDPSLRSRPIPAAHRRRSRARRAPRPPRTHYKYNIVRLSCSRGWPVCPAGSRQPPASRPATR